MRAKYSSDFFPMMGTPSTTCHIILLRPDQTCFPTSVWFEQTEIRAIYISHSPHHKFYCKLILITQRQMNAFLSWSLLVPVFLNWWSSTYCMRRWFQFRTQNQKYLIYSRFNFLRKVIDRCWRNPFFPTKNRIFAWHVKYPLAHNQKKSAIPSEFTWNQKIRVSRPNMCLSGKISVLNSLIPVVASNKYSITYIKDNPGTIPNLPFSTKH
jgi:hypothetical protein